MKQQDLDFVDAPKMLVRHFAVEKAIRDTFPDELTGRFTGPEGSPAAREPKAGRQGKCPTCKECYRWHSRTPLYKAHCPACGDKLQATTYQNRWPWNEGIEPLTAIQAWAKFQKGRI